ncbi:MAG TPA: SGNH/GDSL hydrolase family protein [Cytophagaceae bacterium]|jgi:lysophospholipase L1-like esterase|nr:SGNH/GDSL hydrolase family protein [Cytophagaceae bacterium]
MKKIFSRTLYILACTVIAFACKPKLETPSADKGSLDLTTYVAIGNSITSGYADNALYYAGQQVSYAKLLADQFKLVGGGDFKIPLIDVNSVGIGSTGGARLALMPVTDCLGNTSLSPKTIAASGDLTIFSPIYSAQGPFNNFGVPGAKAIHVVVPGYGNPSNGTGNYNPFFTRMAANLSTSSMLSDALTRHPTFFSLFIGNNDVLLWALSGGTQDAITPTAGGEGIGFNTSIDSILSPLVATAKQGVIANIPDITSIPYFTTVPYNGLVLDTTQAYGLTAAYSGAIVFHTGANAFVIQDAAAPLGFRQITSSEHVLLSVPQDSIKCKGWGSQKPLPNAYVLTANEITQITTATTAFNNKLKSAADAKNLAFVDANAFLKSTITGLTFDGINVSTTFVSGGAFSLDGVHLTPLGNALLANQFILAINAKYGASIPLVDETKYKGVTFP